MTDQLFVVIGLVVLGYLLLAIEVLVIPGFGVTGIGAFFCLGAGCFLAVRYFGTQTGGVIVVAVVVATTGLFIWLPRTPLGRSMMLRRSLKETRSSNPVLVVGERGVTESVLRPSGIARFGTRRESVVSNGEYIDAGRPIRVLRVEGGRVVVETCD